MPATASQLEQYYRRSEPAAVIADFESITTGWENEVYAFRLDTSGETRDLILRVYPGSNAASKAEREYGGMTLLHAAGYPVPQVFTLETDEQHFGRPVVIMERAAGTPMNVLLEGVTLAQAEGYLRQMCALFVRLHQLDPQPFTTRDVTDINRQMIDWYRSRSPDFAPVWDWAGAQPDALDCPAPAVVHQDFHPGNILCDGNTFTVIDWTNINVLDPRIDLAWTLMLVGSFESWEVRDALLAMYESALGRAVTHIDVFEALACARRLYEFVASVRHGAHTMGMRPETVAVMRSQRRHFERVYARLQAITGLAIPVVETVFDEGMG